ncbi:MAG: long-chain-acyl-CoA synthetase, partial [Pseudomonadota bacterium]
MLNKLWRNTVFAARMVAVLRQVKDLQPESTVTIADDFEATVDQYPDKPAFIFEGETTTYAQFDAR